MAGRASRYPTQYDYRHHNCRHLENPCYHTVSLFVAYFCFAAWFMTLRDRISLTWRYGRAQLLIGAVYNLVCMNYLLSEISYTFFVDCFIIKVVVSSITLYLVSRFRDRDAIFFYINLGLSRRKLEISVILADFLALAILLISVLIIHG